MKLTKAIMTLSLCATTLFTGCDLFGSDDEETAANSVSISAATTVAAGDTLWLTGTVTTAATIPDSAWMLSTTYMDNDGSAIETDLIEIGQTTEESDEPDSSLSWNLAESGMFLLPSPSACSGDYTFTMAFTNENDETATGSVTFTVTDGASCLTPEFSLYSDTVTLGSWDHNTLPSSLDADKMEVYFANEAAANSEKIDIWFSNDAGGVMFMSPEIAGNKQFPPKDWATINTTSFATLTTSQADLLSDQLSIDALALTLTFSDITPALSVDDVVMVKTSEDAYVVLKVTSIDASTLHNEVIIAVGTPISE